MSIRFENKRTNKRNPPGFQIFYVADTGWKKRPQNPKRRRSRRRFPVGSYGPQKNRNLSAAGGRRVSRPSRPPSYGTDLSVITTDKKKMKKLTINNKKKKITRNTRYDNSTMKLQGFIFFSFFTAPPSYKTNVSRFYHSNKHEFVTNANVTARFPYATTIKNVFFYGHAGFFNWTVQTTE